MKTGILLGLLLLFSFLSGQEYPIEVLREAYLRSLDDAEYARQWYSELSLAWEELDDALVLGYLG
ncbi:MAG: hypothetical protein JSW54_10080, partial [Fidelibacterota bacterium]